MSKYVLNEETALVLNGEVYVLVKESNPTSNEVCGKCSLYDKCWQSDETLKYSGLCITEDDDQSWFFQRHLIFSSKGGRDLVRLINKCFIHK